VTWGSVIGVIGMCFREVPGGVSGVCRDVVNPFLIRFSAYFSDRIFAIIESFDPRFDVYPIFLYCNYEKPDICLTHIWSEAKFTALYSSEASEDEYLVFYQASSMNRDQNSIELSPFKVNALLNAHPPHPRPLHPRPSYPRRPHPRPVELSPV
jgi:hypothetical protein